MSGDTEAFFQQLVEANRRRLAGIARSYAAPAERDDLLQEILLQLWKSLPRFERRSSADTWVYRIALNTAFTWNRRREPVEAAQVDGGTADAEPHVPSGRHAQSHRSEMEILDEFIASLGGIDRAVFLLYLDDVSYRQIADVTGLSEGAVGVRLHRLKAAFTTRYIKA